MTEKIKIAVIDDEALMRDLISTSVTRMGHEALPFNHAEDFIKSFEPGLVSLVVSDLKMPGKSGVEMAEIVLKKEPALPIISKYGVGRSQLHSLEE